MSKTSSKKPSPRRKAGKKSNPTSAILADAIALAHTRLDILETKLATREHIEAQQAAKEGFTPPARPNRPSETWSTQHGMLVDRVTYTAPPTAKRSMVEEMVYRSCRNIHFMDCPGGKGTTYLGINGGDPDLTEQSARNAVRFIIRRLIEEAEKTLPKSPTASQRISTEPFRKELRRLADIE